MVLLLLLLLLELLLLELLLLKLLLLLLLLLELLLLLHGRRGWARLKKITPTPTDAGAIEGVSRHCCCWCCCWSRGTHEISKVPEFVAAP